MVVYKQYDLMIFSRNDIIIVGDAGFRQKIDEIKKARSGNVFAERPVENVCCVLSSHGQVYYGGETAERRRGRKRIRTGDGGKKGVQGGQRM